jgi:hypothetical protein
MPIDPYMLWFLMALPLVAGVWTYFVCRHRDAPTDKLIEQLASAHVAMRDNAKTCCDTTAMAARVLGESFQKINDVMNTLAEVAMTTHEGAAAERMNSSVLQAARLLVSRGTAGGVELSASGNNGAPSGDNPPPIPARPPITDAERGIKRMGDV